ncbi:MAG: hypothetical protein AAFV88_10885 [Planctomycetota bacterium]
MLRQRKESLKSTLEQVPAWSVLTTHRSVIWGLAALLLCAGLVFVTRQSPQTSLEPLFAGQEIGNVQFLRYETAFSRAGLKGAVHQGGRLLVPRESRHEYLIALEDAGALPFSASDSETPQESMGESLLVSQKERDRRRQQEKATQLGRKISSLADIAWASVDYDEHASGGFDPRIERAASVLIVTQDGTPLSPERVLMIQDLVRGAYAGMQKEDVTVTDWAASKAYKGNEDPGVMQLRHVEFETKRRLTELLDAFAGIRIAVTAVPDPADNAPNVVGTPSVQVSIGIPESQFHSQWVRQFQHQHAENAPVVAPTDSQLASVREHLIQNVRDAVTPFVPHRDEEKAIHIWSFPDDVCGPSYVEASANETHTPQDSWPGFDWNTERLAEASASVLAFAKRNAIVVIPVAALAVISLFVLIAAMKLRSKSSMVPDSEIDSVSAGETAADGASSDHEQRHLREDLAELVEQNPELAAQIVHRWVSDAA